MQNKAVQKYFVKFTQHKLEKNMRFDLKNVLKCAKM